MDKYNIVYVSKHGYTKRYAMMVAEKLGVKAFDLKEAKKNLKKFEPIIYMAGICNSKINELKKVTKRYDVKVICAIGMSFYRETLLELIRIINELEEGFPLFYAQGGLDPKNISMVERFMLNVSFASYGQIQNPTEEDLKTVDMLGNAADYVSEEKLYRLYAYLLEDDSYLRKLEELEAKEELCESSSESIEEIKEESKDE